MTRAGALAVVVVAGAAIVGLSFVNAWIVQDQEIRGEGYRHAVIGLSAWRAAAVPVLSAGAVAALAAAAAAVALLVRPGSVPAWLPVAAAVVAVGLVASTFAPVGRVGHTTTVDLRAGILAPVGLVLGVAMLVAAVAALRPSRRRVALVVVACVAVAAIGVTGRWAALAASAPDDRTWSDGTYTLPATDDAPAITLTIDGEGYRIGERWAGTWEGTDGWTVILDEDPACPDSRGTYHAHGEGSDGTDLRFVKVVDTCEDGARAATLESGTWERQP